MKLYSWNVNGIRAVINKGSFQAFIAEHQPDILCLQETKAMREQVEIDMTGYHEYWNSAVKKGYSGTAIFSKTEALSVTNGFPEDIIQEFNVIADIYGDPNAEGRVISAEFEDFYVVTVYTPNSKGNLSRLSFRYDHWDKAFLAHIQRLEATKPVLVCGDLNVAHAEDDLANPAANVGKHGFTNKERERFQDFLDAGLVDTFRKFTQGNGYYSWWTHWANARARNIGWRIDYWLVSKGIADKVKKAEIHPMVMGSDHCPVSIEIEV